MSFVISHKKLILAIGILLLFVAIPFSSFVIAATDATSTVITNLNQQIEAKKKKVADLEKSIAETKKKITEKETQSASLKNQLALIDNRIRQVELDVELTEEKIDTIALEIQELELTIDQKEDTIARQRAIIGEFVRTMAVEKERGMIEVMATYDSFSEFFHRVQYLQTIEGDLGVSAGALRLAKETLEQKELQSRERHESFEELKTTLVERKKDMSEQASSKERLLSQTRSDELTYKTLLNSLKKQYQQIENEIATAEREMRRKLEEQKKLSEERLQDSGSTRFSWPSPSHYITAYFRDPSYPYRHVFEHTAIDIRAAQGTPIRAAAAGYVGLAKRCTVSSCYSYVMLVHTEGFSTRYGHLSRVSVSDEQFVARGDIIGYSGGTPGTAGAGPFVTGPHLHFEVRKDGLPVNPLTYLPKDE